MINIIFSSQWDLRFEYYKVHCRKEGQKKENHKQNCIQVSRNDNTLPHLKFTIFNLKILQDSALAGVAQLIECQTVDQKVKRLLVPFLVRAHAWVVGQVPSRGHARGNHN